MCIYPVQPFCTFLLHIPAYIIIYWVHIILYCTYYFITHFTLYFCLIIDLFFYLYLCVSSCVVLHILHCPLSEPDLTYISLLIIFCIIEHVANKKNLEPWTLTLGSSRTAQTIGGARTARNTGGALAGAIAELTLEDICKEWGEVLRTPGEVPYQCRKWAPEL